MISVVLPAYNAEKTLKETLERIPKKEDYQILLCDDASKDKTAHVAEKLGLSVLRHERNRGYGGNQKTLYKTALKQGARVIIMLHPDNQYDASVLPQMAELILSGQADFVLGNRLHAGHRGAGGMPLWKFIANRGLTAVQNTIYGTNFGELHTGLRGYSRRALENISYENFSDDFVFDSEMIASMIARKMRIAEVPVQTKYFNEASSINFQRSAQYGIETLRVLYKFKRGHYN